MTTSPPAATRAELRRARRQKDERPGRWRLPVLAVIVAVLALAGLLTVLYPTVAGWFHQYEQSQVIDRLSGEVQQLPAEGLSAALAEARVYTTSSRAVEPCWVRTRTCPKRRPQARWMAGPPITRAAPGRFQRAHGA